MGKIFLSVAADKDSQISKSDIQAKVKWPVKLSDSKSLNWWLVCAKEWVLYYNSCLEIHFQIISWTLFWHPIQQHPPQ